MKVSQVRFGAKIEWTLQLAMGVHICIFMVLVWTTDIVLVGIELLISKTSFILEVGKKLLGIYPRSWVQLEVGGIMSFHSSVSAPTQGQVWRQNRCYVLTNFCVQSRFIRGGKNILLATLQCQASSLYSMQNYGGQCLFYNKTIRIFFPSITELLDLLFKTSQLFGTKIVDIFFFFFAQNKQWTFSVLKCQLFNSHFLKTRNSLSKACSHNYFPYLFHLSWLNDIIRRKQ